MENKELLEKFAEFIKEKKLSAPEDFNKDIIPVWVDVQQLKKWSEK